MAKLSLQEQLLKSGLVSDAQAKKIKSDKNKQLKQQQKNKVEIIDEAKMLAQQAQALKLVKDRELNQRQNAENEQKAITAQLKQLIELNSVLQEPEGIPYHFIDDGLVKTIYVNQRVRQQLITGHLAIVRYEGGYCCISEATANKIRARDQSFLIIVNEVVADNSADDPYAAFTIPDDLMW